MIIFVVSTNRIKYFYLQKRNKGKKSVSVNNRKYKINTKLTIKCKQNLQFVCEHIAAERQNRRNELIRSAYTTGTGNTNCGGYTLNKV